MVMVLKQQQQQERKNEDKKEEKGLDMGREMLAGSVL